jgi:hypothetical protein
MEARLIAEFKAWIQSAYGGDYVKAFAAYSTNGQMSREQMNQIVSDSGAYTFLFGPDTITIAVFAKLNAGDSVNFDQVMSLQ